MNEIKDFSKIIGATRTALGSMKPGDWERLAEQVTSDSAYMRHSENTRPEDALTLHNLPIALRHLLKDETILTLDEVKLAIAFAKDQTIPHEVIAPLGGLLNDNLALMRDKLQGLR